MKDEKFQQLFKTAPDFAGAVVLNNKPERKCFCIVGRLALEEFRALFSVLKLESVNVQEVEDGKEAEDVIFESGLKQALHLPFQNIGLETLFHISGRCALNDADVLNSKAVERLIVKTEPQGTETFATLDGFIMTGEDFEALRNFHFRTLWKPEIYQPFTTFWTDFSIAEEFGFAAVKETFETAFEGWKDNYRYLTELVMVMNHKLNYFYQIAQQMERLDERFANLTREQALRFYSLYLEQYDKANDYALDNLKDEEFSYFYEITN